MGDTDPITSPAPPHRRLPPSLPFHHSLSNHLSCITPPSSPSITPLPSLPLESPPDVHAIHSIRPIHPIHPIHPVHTLFLQTIMSSFSEKTLLELKRRMDSNDDKMVRHHSSKLYTITVKLSKFSGSELEQLIFASIHLEKEEFFVSKMRKFSFYSSIAY